MRSLKFLLVTASFLSIIQVMQVIHAGQEPAPLTQRAAAAVAQQLYSELDKKSYQDILKSLSELPIPQELKEPIIAKLNEIILASKPGEILGGAQGKTYFELRALIAQLNLPQEFKKQILQAVARTVASRLKTKNGKPIIPAPITPEKLTQELINAVERNAKIFAQTFIDAGADVNSNGYIGDPLLIIAVAKGYREIAKALIEAGASVNAQDRSGEPVLMAAINAADADMVKYLLAYGALVSLQDLKMAQERGLDEIAQLLREAAAKQQQASK